MNKDKGVRRYGRFRQTLRWGKFYAHQFVVAPVMIAAFAAFFLGCLYVGIFLLCMLVDLCHPWDFVDAGSDLLLALFSGGMAVLGNEFLKKYHQTPAGNVFNPAPPDEDTVLPDEDLLVRASSPTEAQPAELLRATQETKEEKPEELLRAGTKE